jgi:predicted outer membrane repeat protein
MQKWLRQLIVLGLLATVGIPSAAPGQNALAWPGHQPAGRLTPHRIESIAWYDGLIQYSTITNCFSIIQGMPYLENGAGTYVGFVADPNAGLPGPNQSYYVHVVIAGLGNSCSGQRAYIDLALPANSSLAINATDRVRCYYDGTPLSAAECPQTLPASSYNPGAYVIPSSDNAHANLWPIPQGHILEIQVPIRSSTALTNSPLRANVWMLDGNSSPWLHPEQGVYVFSNTPTIIYPSPSTITVTATTAHSQAYLYTFGATGTGYFDLGTDTSYGLVHEPVAITSAGTAWLVWDDWGPPPLQPDTLYHWRFTFTANSQTYYGADQTFRTLPDGRVTIGNGAAASCTSTAFTAALSTAKEILFDCGALPITLTLSSAQSIASNVTINGGNKVTLDMAHVDRHFLVQSGAALTLTQITLVNGQSNCGGAVNVAGNARLTLNEARLIGNHSSLQGGAVCVNTNGAATIANTLFMSNTAGTHGGAIGNYGSTSISDSKFTGNTAGINGGGIDTTVALSMIDTTFISNTAGFRGGGVNNFVGVMSISNSSFSRNGAGMYGGGLSNDAGPASIGGSTFDDNHAPNGGGVENSGTLNMTNSTLSANHALASGGPITATGGGLYWVGGSIGLLNTTLVSNTATTQGGNIYAGGATNVSTTLKNTLIAFGSPNNCDAHISSQGDNLESANTCGLTSGGDLIDLDPRVGPLQNNGGSTLTHALELDSPARDAGTNSGCPATDQRGVTRPQGARCDIGAYEGLPVRRVYVPLLKR